MGLDHVGNKTIISNSPWVFIMLEISLFSLTVSEAGSCWKSDYFHLQSVGARSCWKSDYYISLTVEGLDHVFN